VLYYVFAAYTREYCLTDFSNILLEGADLIPKPNISANFDEIESGLVLPSLTVFYGLSDYLIYATETSCDRYDRKRQILNLVKIDDLITCLYSGIVHHANHSIIFKLHRNVAPRPPIADCSSLSG